MSEEKITKLEINMARIEEKFTSLEEKLIDFKNLFVVHDQKESENKDRLMNIINDFIESADTKYASKDTVKTLIGAIVTIIVSLILAGIYAVMNHLVK